MVKVLDDAFGLRSCFVTTVHAFTNDQNLLDLSHPDLRRARSAPTNITLSSTGAARAIGLVLPDMAGRLDGLALRVPVPDGSITDLACSLERHPKSRAEVNEAFADAAAGGLRSVPQFTTVPLVSTDILGNPSSCVFSAVDTMVGPEHVKVLGWYDNEWGYANRVVDLAEHVGVRSVAQIAG
jgi:glyceraldehyde 3-phosphate dehydrogenase